MKAVVQRVYDAAVVVEQRVVGKIDTGLLVYLGIHRDDTDVDAQYITKKILNMRIYPLESKPMHCSVLDVKGALLIISQFTLFGALLRGNRPDFFSAALPEHARKLYETVCTLCAATVPVERGVFGAHMSLRYTNDGPVTILLDSAHLAHHKQGS